MCHWKSWIWPGILTVAILSALALWMRSDLIEADVRAQAESRLAASGLGWAKVAVDGRDVSVTGIAPLEGQDANAIEAVEDQYSVRVANTQLELLPAQSPYTLGATRDGEAVSVTGYVPDEATREAVLASAKEALPEAEIKDELELARGAPDALKERAAFGFGQLAGLSAGAFALSDDTYSIDGDAASQDTFGTIDTALGAALPGGATLGNRDVRSPAISPYVFAADYDGQAVTLTGYAPDAEARASVETAAKAMLPNASVSNELQIAAGAPEGYSAQVESALTALPRLSKGRVELSDSALTARGEALSSADYDAVTGDLNGDLPGGATLALAEIELSDVSPYVTEITKDGDAVRLTGLAPSADAKDAAEASIKANLPEATITNELTLAEGAPEGYGEQFSGTAAILPLLEDGKATLSDGALTVDGTARNAIDFEAAVIALEGTLPGGATLASRNITAPGASPYTTNAFYDGKSVRLTGFAPDRAARDRVEAAAKEALPDAAISNDLKIASGAPEGFVDQATGALAVLPRLSSGSVSLTDGSLAARGVARSGDDFETVTTALNGDLPGNARLASADITAPAVTPYVTGIVYDGNVARLTGSAPSVDARAGVERAVAEALPGVQITNEVAIASGAPEGYGAQVAGAVNILSGLSTGEVSLKDGALTAKGAARTGAEYERTTGQLAGELDGGATLALAEITPPAVGSYSFGADYDGKAIVLRGFVPDAETREAVNAAARETVPEAIVDDRLEFADGAPEGFSTNAPAVLAPLARFESGRVDLDKDSLRISGKARSVDAYETAISDLDGKLPDGVTELEVANMRTDITPADASPYTLDAVRDGKSVTLTGYAVSTERRDAVAAEAAKGDLDVTNDIRIAGGAPDGHADRVSRGLTFLNRVDEGSAAIADDELTLKGRMREVGAYETALNEAGSADTSGVSPAVATPYRFEAALDESTSPATITLQGNVPDTAKRAAIAELASGVTNGAKVVDRTTIAEGAPDGFDAEVADGLAFLPTADETRFTIEDEKIARFGRYRQPGEFEKGLETAGEVDVTGLLPPRVEPYAMKAELQAETVTLSGYAPDIETRDALGEAAKAAYPGREVKNELLIATGEPEAFGRISTGAVGLLPKMKTGSVGLENADLSIVGEARSPADYAALNGIGAARVDLVPPAIEGPYVTGFERTAEAVIVSGAVPSDEARKSLLAKTGEALPGVKVEDRTELYSGAPEGREAELERGLAFLSDVDTGRAVVTNRELDVEGQASSVDAFERAGKRAGEAAADGAGASRIAIQPAEVKPYSWSATKAADGVVLEGFVPSGKERDRVVAFAGKTLGTKIDDRMRIAAGAPKGFSGAVDRSIEEIKPLDEGVAKLDDTALTVRGKAGSEADANAVKPRLETALASGFGVTTDISFPPPAPAPEPAVTPEPTPEPKVETPEAKEPEVAVVTPPAEPAVPAAPVCDVNFKSLFEGESILFATNRAIIRKVSYPLLDRIADAKKNCPDASFRITGHTDSRGKAEFNQRLSEARANAVRRYMSDKGVPLDRIDAVGAGEAKPIASNRSRSGRARNRRIEFTVIE